MPQERTINTTYIERLEGVIQLSSEFYSEIFFKNSKIMVLQRI